MPTLSTRKRSELRDSAFAYVDPQGRRRLPIHDESHVRNALSRFNQVVFEDDTARDKARTRLLNAAKKYGIVPVGFVTGQLRAHGKQQLPTGQVTILMTDIEGSTALLLKLGDRYAKALTDTRRFARTAVRQAGGWEVDARADEFFAVFRQAHEAIGASLSIQRRVRDQAWPEGVKLRLRMGIHSGRPTLTDGGYIGVAVHTASRITALACGGQIMLSKAAVTALGERQLEAVRFVELGEHHLRGLGSHALYHVAVDDLPSDFPAPGTR